MRLKEQQEKVDECSAGMVNHKEAIALISKELQRFKSEINKKHDVSTKRLTYVERHVDIKNQIKRPENKT
jgi:hypothetical protein